MVSGCRTEHAEGFVAWLAGERGSAVARYWRANTVPCALIATSPLPRRPGRGRKRCVDPVESGG
jgi:hypothetical protein